MKKKLKKTISKKGKNVVLYEGCNFGCSSGCGCGGCGIFKIPCFGLLNTES